MFDGRNCRHCGIGSQYGFSNKISLRIRINIRSTVYLGDKKHLIMGNALGKKFYVYIFQKILRPEQIQ